MQRDDQRPVMARIRTRTEFGAVLTDLRQRSGRSLRDLADAVGSSASTLSGWCRAERLPFPAQDHVFDALLTELGVADTEPWLDALRRVRDVRAPSRAADGNPYPGLESLGPGDADRFFGRDRLVQTGLAVLDQVRSQSSVPDLVTFVGPSGSGKSSLLQAGLRPVLERRGWTTGSLTPGADPLAALAEALATLLADTRTATELLETAPTRWNGVVARRLPSGVAPLLIVDHLEELFTECGDPTRREGFLDALTSLVRPTGSGPAACAALLGMRVDFYAEIVTDGHLTESLQAAQVLVGPMDEDELVEVIVGPARHQGVTVDDELVTAVLRDFLPAGALGGRHDAGALPLLSHALAETWAHGSGNHMTIADYHAAGGLAGAVEQSAERTVAELDDAQVGLLRQVLLRLVNVDEHVTTRRAAPLEELAGLDPEPDGLAVSDLVQRFAAARLLTLHATSATIAHEALLSAWPRLRRWIAEDREALRSQRSVTEAAAAWRDHGEDPSMLASGARLDGMLEHADAAEARLPLTHHERRFLAASEQRRDAAERAAARGARRLRLLAAAALTLGLVASVAGVVALSARDDAIAAENAALSRQIALTADGLAGTDATLAAQLAVAGYGIAPTSEARSALLEAARRPFGTRLLGGAGTTALAATADGSVTAVSDAVAATVRLLEDQGSVLATIHLDEGVEVYALTFDPAGDLLFIGDTSATVTVVDVRDPGDPRRLGEPLEGLDGPVQDLAVHPGGREVAAVGLGDGVLRWHLDDPAAPEPLPTLPVEEITWSVDYHPDGGSLVAGDDVGIIRSWELGASTDADDDEGRPAPVVEVAAGNRAIHAVAFSPDGGQLAAGSRAGTAHLFDLAGPSAPAELTLEAPDFDSWVNTVAFSSDGAVLAAGSSDAYLRTWNTGTGARLVDLAHPAGLTDVVFTHGGDRVATAATDGSVRTWDLTRDTPLVLEDRVWGLDFSVDGGTMAAFTGTETGLLDVGGRSLGPVRQRLPEPSDGPDFSGAGAMSPDGRLLAHGTITGEVVLFEVASDGRIEPLGEPLDAGDALIEVLTFDPDGTVLAAGGTDTTVRLWDLTDPADPVALGSLDDPDEIVLDLTRHPDEPLLAVASADSQVYLYDVADPSQPTLVAELAGFDSEAYAVAFHPDGQLLATGGTDQYVQLWDVTDPAEPVTVGAPVTGPVGRIYKLAYAPDGGLLAAAVTDGSTWLWDTEEPTDPVRHAVLDPADAPMYTVAFDPGGSLLVASGADPTIRWWPLDEDAIIADICARVGDPLTEAEWGTYLPAREFEAPCG